VNYELWRWELAEVIHNSRSDTFLDARSDTFLDVVEYHLTDIQNVNVLNEKIMLPVKGKTKKCRRTLCKNNQSITLPKAEQ
jgi:hypothetical protein